MLEESAYLHLQVDLRPGRLASTRHNLLGRSRTAAGALRAELSYFTRCIRLGERPPLLMLVEACRAVAAYLGERTVSSGTGVTLQSYHHGIREHIWGLGWGCE